MNPETVLAFLENHVWQSTVFALAAGALSLMLRHDRAAVRHRLWVAASIKFLIPLSMLVAIGGQFQGMWQAPASVTPTLDAFEQWNEPFMPVPDAPATSPYVYMNQPKRFPWESMILALWFVGTVIVTISSMRRSQQMKRTVRVATLLSSGFEFDAVERLRKVGRVRRRILIVCSDSMIEPGLLGVALPTLFLPAALRQKLTNEQLEAILAHEVMHARRHDNLWTMLHMIVEAAFWFNPIVWWLGARLIDERERACDQEVLSAGFDCSTYAQAMVEVCKSYLGAPLKCVSGVTGATIQRRVEAIMAHGRLPRLNIVKTVSLVGLTISVICVPLLFGSLRGHRISHGARSQTEAPSSLSFEVASIKPHPPGGIDASQLTCHGIDAVPLSDRTSFSGLSLDAVAQFTQQKRPAGLGRCILTNLTLKGLIDYAYDLRMIRTGFDEKIIGGPIWSNSAKFDIEAKAPDPSTATFDDLKEMIRSLLAKQFGLKFHREARETAGFLLLISKNGAKMAFSSSADPSGTSSRRDLDGTIHMQGRSVDLAGIARTLSGRLGRPVVDGTGLTGSYDFTLTWSGDPETAGESPVSSAALITALGEQLGLRVEARKVAVDVVVIDSAQEPAQDAREIGMLAPKGFVEATSLKTANIVRRVEQRSSDDKSRATEPPQPTQLASIRPVLPSVLTQTPAPKFEVASIKPLPARPPGPITTSLRASTKNGRMTFDAINTKLLIIQAYDLQADVQIKGPSWIDTDWFTVIAKAERADASSEDVRAMLRTLLADRFKLVIHRETTEATIQALVQGKDGAKLQEADPSVSFSATQTPEGLLYQRTRLGVLASALSAMTRQPVRDMTGLTGIYTFTLNMRLADPDRSDKDDPARASDPMRPILRLEAPLAALGLKLEARKAPVDNLIIDRVEHPTPN